MERFKLIPAVFVLLVKGDQIFLARRINTGWEDETYSLPGGHLDGRETVTSAAVREAKEELGINIKPEDLQFATVTHTLMNDERIHFSFVAKKWEGIPTNNEPDKSDDARWFPLDKLPETINTISRDVIESYREKRYYHEFGWKNE